MLSYELMSAVATEVRSLKFSNVNPVRTRTGDHQERQDGATNFRCLSSELETASFNNETLHMMCLAKDLFQSVLRSDMTFSHEFAFSIFF